MDGSGQADTDRKGWDGAGSRGSCWELVALYPSVLKPLDLHRDTGD